MDGTSISPEQARYWLRDIEPKWKGFWLHMHLVAFNLAQFAEGVAAINDEIFSYHVSGQKNDFAKWVREVVGDSELAQALEAARTREEAARVLRYRVEDLKNAAEQALDSR